MTPGLSTYVFFQHRLHPGLLDALAAAGATTIEVFAARHHFDYTDAHAIRDLASWFRSNPVRAVLHQPIYLTDRADTQWSRHVAPNLDLIAPEKLRRISSLDEVKRAIESAEQVPFAAVVLHLGLRDSAWDEAALDRSLTAVEHLKAFAAPLGVRLLLENLQNEVATPGHLLEVLRTGHFDSAGISLDIGQLHLATPATTPRQTSFADTVAAALHLLGPRLAQLHLHDNHGALAPTGSSAATYSDIKDERLWPGEGTIPWPSLTPLFDTLSPATPMTLEIASDPARTPALTPGQITQRARETFSSLALPVAP